MDKKAQGLSLNTIIIAIVVLIVLVVLIMVFTGYIGNIFTPAITDCSNAGGVCQADLGGDAPCGYDAFSEPKAQLKKGVCNEDLAKPICCARGLGTGNAPTQNNNPPPPSGSGGELDPSDLSGPGRLNPE